MNTAPKQNTGFSGRDLPSYEFIINCMHCGLCLAVCPTYALTGSEKSSPRGRIRLMKAVSDGELPLSPGFIDEMNLCLDCQACETACPAGVRYGSLVESARVQIQDQGKQHFLEKYIKKIFLKHVLASSKLLKITARLLRIYQTSGLEWFLEKSGILPFISPHLAEVQKLAPRVDRVFSDDRYPEVIEPYGEVKHTVGFLSGCLMNVAFADINQDTIEVLRYNHCRIIMPHDQECCGSMPAHNGDYETTRKLARHNCDVFLRYDLDAVVMNSAGCGALMKEYGEYLHGDSMFAEKGKRLAALTKDITEFLLEINFDPPVSSNKKATYHDACHLIHAQKISVQPREILKKIPGIELVELRDASWCCGSAGTYNIIHYDESMRLLERKMKAIEETGADIAIASNPGCLAQMNYGREKFAVKTKILHLATFLHDCYRHSRKAR